MEVYFLTQNLYCPFDIQYRVSPLHGVVFHGVIEIDTVVQESNVSSSGKVSTSVFGKVVISRSGDFIPQVFIPSSTSMILCNDICNRISLLGNIVYSPVVFAKMVRIGMPPIGDCSWYVSAKGSYEKDPAEEITSREDCPEYHLNSPKFFRLACPVVYRLKNMIPDIKKVEANFGSYSCGFRRKVLVSKLLIESYPAIWDDVFILRQDAFEIIAPHLDMDHFLVAYAQI